ncbi:hypothetical protein GYH30_034870 [Glycine max]|uniref:Endonuclease/exonuclease/phosphatase domain-containing protein n=1 Tax=Glycine max TaxID=3847 RepID=A0A0R0GGV2_SOYBN|nr:hypothetical protein GYH30_034870 [Glycine max]
MDYSRHISANARSLLENNVLYRPSKEINITGFKLWYTGKVRGKNGVGTMVDKVWKKSAVDIKKIGDKILAVIFMVAQETINIINAYAPQVGTEAHKFFLGGDLNGHVGIQKRQFTGAHGGFGFRDLNKEGQTIIDFSMAYDVKIMNTCFQKREEHLITYKSGSSRSHIDFFLVKSVDKRVCKDCKVIPGEIYWRKVVGKQGNANLIWDGMAKKIRKFVKAVMGESKGFGLRDKESWWQDEKVKENVKNKRQSLEILLGCNNAENWSRYQYAGNETRKVISEA